MNDVIAWALAKLGDPRAAEPLIAVLVDPDGYVSLDVIAALGTLRDPRAVEPLIAVLSDPDNSVRWNAIESLWEIKDGRATEPLIRMLSDPDMHVRRNAVNALGSLGDARAVDPLISMLSDANSVIRFDVIHALWNIGLDARVVEPLPALSTSPPQACSTAAMWRFSASSIVINGVAPDGAWSRSLRGEKSAEVRMSSCATCTAR